MNENVLDCTIKDLFKFNKSIKLKAIKLLIDSIADNKALEAKAWMETEIEYKEQK